MPPVFSTLDWTIDIQGPNGGANLQTAVPYKSFRFTKTADGPGSAEIDLNQDQVGDIWAPGSHRVIIKHNGTPQFAGYNNGLVRQGAPGEYNYKVLCNGLAWILDKRIVRGIYNITGTLAQIAESLLLNAQAQLNGDMGFTFGSVTGTPITRTEAYCFGVIIGDALRDLSTEGRGMDWEIDASGFMNVWDNTRGVNTGITLEDTEVQGWGVELDTEEMSTTLSSIGEPADPFGPRHAMARTTYADSYGRRETTIDYPADEKPKLERAAEAALRAVGGAGLRVDTYWVEGYGAWAYGAVGIQDKVTVNLPSFFGGNQLMRVIDLTTTVDPNREGVWFMEHTLESLVTDITVGDPDEVEPDEEAEDPD